MAKFTEEEQVMATYTLVIALTMVTIIAAYIMVTVLLTVVSLLISDVDVSVHLFRRQYIPTLYKVFAAYPRPP